MLFIFDLDGTLVDSIEDLSEATNKAMSSLQRPTYPLETYRHFVGNGVKKLIERALGDEHLDLYPSARAIFDHYYQDHCLDHTFIYDGLKDMIIRLKAMGCHFAVVTNKPHHLAKKIVSHLFGDDIFVSIIGQQEGYPLKPNPYFVLDIMKQWGKDAVYIGDSDVDIYTGINANIQTIGVLWGNRSQKELEEAGATYIVNDSNELEVVLRGLLS